MGIHTDKFMDGLPFSTTNHDDIRAGLFQSFFRDRRELGDIFLAALIEQTDNESTSAAMSCL
jgi:hypothetical protein